MANDGSSRFYSKNNNRVSHTLHTKTTFENSHFKKRSASYNRIKRNVCNHSTNETAGRSEGSRSFPKLCFDSISSAKGRRDTSSGFQSEVIESVCANRPISSSKHVPCSGFPPTWGLDVQGGLGTGLFQSSDSPYTQTVPTSYIRERIIRNDLPAVRTKHCSENIRVSYELDSTSSATKGCKDHCLFGRLPRCSSKSERFKGTCGYATGHSTDSGSSNKLREVRSGPTTMHNLSRHYLGPLDKSQVPASGEVCCYCKQSLSVHKKQQIHTKGTPEPSRSFKFCQLCCTSRQVEPSSDPFSSKHATKVHNLNQIQSTLRGYKGNALVARQLSSFNTNTCTTTHTFPNYRCLGCSVGSSARRPFYVRNLEQGGAIPTLQHEGTVDDIESSRSACTKHGSWLNADPIRQSFSDSLSPQRRGGEISISHKSNPSNFVCPGRVSDSLPNLPYSRKIQQSRRLPVQTSSASGVAPSPKLHRNDFSEDGNSRDRPVRIQNSTSGSQLRNPRSQRSPSVESRCVQLALEFPTSMGVSTALPDSSSLNALKSGHRNLSDGSAALGKGLLESGSQIPGRRTPVYTDEFKTVPSRHEDRAATSESTGHGSGGMEVWGWSETISSWNPNQISLLKSSWRPSTWKTYKVAWNRWLLWTKQNNVNPVRPNGGQLAQFLADLYLNFKFSYNTILLHKSVISTLCNTQLSSKLSEDVLVKHILKSISLKNPKTAKPPVWDINVLSDYLSKYSVDSSNIFQTVRHTATLLILCSGRRIHDLTLLDTRDDHCIINTDSIIFWPLFGSKTDCSDYRQSGWKFLVNPDKQKLDPVYWINKTITILNERRSKSESSNLFITLRGSPRPASRSVIAGWIKTLLREAGITSTPGSMRSAVASRNFADNLPLDDILARGNWKSVKTFQKFYRRDIIMHTNNSSVTSLFNPVE